MIGVFFKSLMCLLEQALFNGEGMVAQSGRIVWQGMWPWLPFLVVSQFLFQCYCWSDLCPHLSLRMTWRCNYEKFIWRNAMSVFVFIYLFSGPGENNGGWLWGFLYIPISHWKLGAGDGSGAWELKAVFLFLCFWQPKWREKVLCRVLLSKWIS